MRRARGAPRVNRAPRAISRRILGHPAGVWVGESRSGAAHTTPDRHLRLSSQQSQVQLRVRPRIHVRFEEFVLTTARIFYIYPSPPAPPPPPPPPDTPCRSLEGSSNCLLCVRDFYLDAQSKCVQAPEGAEAERSGTTLENMRIAPGYYRFTAHSATPYVCPHFANCVGGRIRANGTVDESLCKLGATGSLCSYCIGNFFLSKHKGCTPCRGTSDKSYSLTRPPPVPPHPSNSPSGQRVAGAPHRLCAGGGCGGGFGVEEGQDTRVHSKAPFEAAGNRSAVQDCVHDNANHFDSKDLSHQRGREGRARSVPGALGRGQGQARQTSLTTHPSYRVRVSWTSSGS